MSAPAWRQLEIAARDAAPDRLLAIMRDHWTPEAVEMARAIESHNAEHARIAPPPAWKPVVDRAEEVVMQSERATILAVARLYRDSDDPWAWVDSSLMQAVDYLTEVGIIFQRPDTSNIGGGIEVSLNEKWEG